MLKSAGGRKPLPPEYQEVEYVIVNNSGAYLNVSSIWFMNWLNDKVEGTARFDMSVYSINTVIQTRGSQSSNIYATFYGYFTLNGHSSTLVADSNEHHFVSYPTHIEVDGVDYNYARDSMTINATNIFSQYTGGDKNTYVKEIIVNDGDTAWFVPCVRKSDNLAGVYDIVSDTFFGHSKLTGVNPI